MGIVHGMNPEGTSTDNTNPVLIGAKDINGDSIFLTTDADGRLQVATDLQVASVTATDITIHDPTTPENKLTIDTDGKAAVKAADLEGLIGEADDAPTANTLLARMKSLEDKIDAITAGTTPAVTQLSGSKMELYGVAIEDRPDANTVAVGATFTIVDDTGNFDSYISNGTDWLEV